MPFPKNLSRIASVAEGATTDGWVKNLPWIVSAALVVLLAWQLVQLAWTLLGARKAPATVASASPVAAPAGPAIDVQAIINAHLFGTAAAPSAPRSWTLSNPISSGASSRPNPTGFQPPAFSKKSRIRGTKVV